MESSAIILSTAYLPPVEYFAAIASSKQVILEVCENYQKQSYRNRCRILSADGVLPLSIPIARVAQPSNPIKTHKASIGSIEIDYSQAWLQMHTRAIDAAYMNSPFYEYYRSEFLALLCSKEKNLLKYNTALTELLLRLCGIRAELVPTTDYYPASYYAQMGVEDLREVIHPKRPSLKRGKPYWQAFAKQGFTPNLSVIDLLFNEGPDAISYL